MPSFKFVRTCRRSASNPRYDSGMERVFVRLAVVAAIFLLLVGCDLWPFGPSKSVAGNWHFTSGKFSTFQMSLTQSGDSISGVACVYPLGGIRPFPVRETAVTGDYPRIRFADPWVADCEYDMTFEEDREQIAGDCGGRRLVRFNRSDTGRCEGAALP
jgi:hypothetical protein